MKRGKTFKYSILMFVLMASFFIFSKASVSAEEIIINEKLSFVVEEVDSEYFVSSVDYSCTGTEEECKIEELVIPNEYDSKPIVGIKDGSVSVDPDTAIKTFYGTLDGLKDVKIKKIVTGTNMQTIGQCAFCNLNVESVHVSGSVISIGEYAFANSAVKRVYINRYEPLAMNGVFSEVQTKTFYDANELMYIVFPGEVTFSQYKSNGEVWKELDVKDKYTYEIVYKYYDGSEYKDEKTYYYGFALGELYRDLSRLGFDFLGWYYVDGDKVTVNDLPLANQSVTSKWELTALNLEMGSFVDGEEDLDNKIVYAGKGYSLDIVVLATPKVAISGHLISYSWDVNLDSGAYEQIDGNDTNHHSLSFASQSGTYNCYVTLEYEGYTRVDVVSLKAVVEKKPITVNVGTATVTYGTYVSVDDFDIEIVGGASAFAQGEYLKYFEFKGYTNNNSEIEVGTYEDVLVVELMSIGYEDDAFEYKSNYDIRYNYGDLIVVKKTLQVGLILENSEIEYGDEENLSAVMSHVIYKSEANPDGIGKLIELTYSRKEPNDKSAGRYEIDGVTVDDSKNFDVSLDSDDYVFVIEPKEVDVVWGNYNFVYDGNVKNVEAHYVDVNGQNVSLVVKISQNSNPASLIDAGEYVADIDLEGIDENYSLDMDKVSKKPFIEQADAYFIENLSQAVTYNGRVQTVMATPNHSEPVKIDKNPLLGECKGATTDGNPCKIEVTMTPSKNYKGHSEIFSLHINKYRLVVTPDLFEVPYGNFVEGYLLQDVEGAGGEIVQVKFKPKNSDSSWDAGYYSIGSVSCNKSKDADNYIVTLEDGSEINKIKVVKVPIRIRFHFHNNLVYTGQVFNVVPQAEGAVNNEIVEVSWSYEGDKIPLNAGTYTINASIDEDGNYYIEGSSSLTFEIAKADYDVSSLSLKDKKVSFDFKSHSLLLEGELPEGLTAKYTIDGKDGNATLMPFKHEIKVVFEGDFDNYNYVEPMVAVLNINMTWVFVTLGLTLLSFGVIVGLFIFLVKTNKIRFSKRFKRKIFHRIMKKNKALDEVNAIIVSARDSKKEEEDIPFIEEGVKFAKTEPIKVNTEIISKSFVDELFKADIRIKEYYSEIKNELLSYVGVSSKIKRDYETFYLNNVPIARVDIENGCLFAFYSLDPATYNKQEYKHDDVSKKKEFGAVPMKLAVNSLESLRHAKMFVRIIRKRENIKSVSNFVRMDYAKIYTAKESSLKIFKKVFSKKKKGQVEED